MNQSYLRIEKPRNWTNILRGITDLDNYQKLLREHVSSNEMAQGSKNVAEQI